MIFKIKKKYLILNLNKLLTKMCCFLTLKGFCYYFLEKKIKKPIRFLSDICQNKKNLIIRDLGLKYGCRIFSIRINGNCI